MQYISIYLLFFLLAAPIISSAKSAPQKDGKVFLLSKSVRALKKDPKGKEKYPWNIADIGAKTAQKKTSGKSVRVAIFDTGIDLDHPDLQSNVRGGINILDPSSSFDDDNGHGSQMAGIVAAAKNKNGIVGVAPQVDLFAVKVIGADGTGRVSDVIKGIDWAIENKIQIINMSFGTKTYSSLFESAVKKAINSGIIVIAATGNNGNRENQILYPAKFPGVISVSATDRKNRIASWSYHGPETTVSAPGSEIFSTSKDGGYCVFDGTSAAASHVAATAALILTRPVGKYDTNENNSWDPEEVKNKLIDTAETVSKKSSPFKKINAQKAVR